MGEQGSFELQSEVLGALPLVNHFFDKLGLKESFGRHVPANDRRLALEPASVLGVVVRNLVLSHRPLYSMGEWASAFSPAELGLQAGDAALLNDDRVGRTLERLFDADRASLLTEVVVGAIRRFGIDTSQLHNDSTSVKLTGAYRSAGGQSRGGKPTASVTFGYSKDRRPDLRQLVFILTVSADGAVPIAHRVESGNTSDDPTHVPTWDELVRLVGRSDFLYVADCKLASREAMAHIDDNGGRFVTVLPRSRKEDGWFRDWLTRNTAPWAEVKRIPSRRRGEPPEVMSTYEAAQPTGEGYRIIWIHSSAKATRDTMARAARMQRGCLALEAIASRLKGPKCRLRTRVAVEEEAREALEELGASLYFDLSVREELERTYRATGPGGPGVNTRYKAEHKPRFILTWKIRDYRVKAEAASDGCWPLVTNDAKLTPAEVLAAYRYQPNLERRHHILKGHQAVAPVYVHDPARIEALLCCHFLALLIGALMERQARKAMAAGGTEAIALYPEERDCKAPSAARLMEIFDGLQRHRIVRDGRVVQVIEPELSPLQLQVLKLMGVPATAYRDNRPDTPGEARR